MSHKEAARGFVCLIITQPELKCGGAISDEADSAPKGDCFVTPALPLRYASGTIVVGSARVIRVIVQDAVLGVLT